MSQAQPRAKRRKRRAFDLAPGTEKNYRTAEKQDEFNALSVSERKDRYLAAYEAAYGLSARACRAIGCRHSNVIQWRDEDEEFRERMDEVATHADETLRSHIMTRAMGLDGERPSDLLAIFEAKRRMEPYRDKAQGLNLNFHDNRTQNMVVLSLDELRQGISYLEDKGQQPAELAPVVIEQEPVE